MVFFCHFTRLVFGFALLPSGSPASPSGECFATRCPFLWQAVLTPSLRRFVPPLRSFLLCEFLHFCDFAVHVCAGFTFQAKSLAVPGAASSSCVPRLPLGARDRSHPEHSCVFLPFVLSSWCVAPLCRGPFCFAVPVKASRPAAQATVHASRTWAATPGSSSEGDAMVFVLGLGTVS